MHLKQLTIRRDGYYGYGKVDPTRPLACTIELEGDRGSVTLNLDPDMSKRVLDLVASEVAAAGRATAERMTAEVISGTPMLEGAE